MALRSPMCFWMSMQGDDCADAVVVRAASTTGKESPARLARARRDASAGQERDGGKRDNGLILRSRVKARGFSLTIP